MKKFYFLFFTILISGYSFSQDLIISGVIDGPLPGGFPKGIELYVVNNISDLSLYGLERAGNGDASTGSQTYTFPAVSHTAGDFIYISILNTNAAAAFSQYLGVTLTYQSDAVNHNGDDAILLYYNGSVSDVYGVVGTDGTGEPWESLDGWAYRNDASSPSSTFSLSEWTFSGANALDGCDLTDDTGTNAGCSSVFPVGTYSATLSTKTNKIEGFSMYPNPTDLGYVNISSRNNAEINISVFDVLGKQVINKTVTNNRLDVSNLKSGVYIMKATEEDAVTTKKLVIR